MERIWAPTPTMSWMAAKHGSCAVSALVRPSEVMDNQPMLDLLWRVRFRWKLWPRQVTGDRKYGTEDNIVAIEREQISAYIPSPDFDHRTGFFSPDRFHYEAERDVYLCP